MAKFVEIRRQLRVILLMMNVLALFLILTSVFASNPAKNEWSDLVYQKRIKSSLQRRGHTLGILNSDLSKSKPIWDIEWTQSLIF